MSSYDNADLVNRNNVEGQSKLGLKLGYKTGRARTTFAATGGLATGTYATGLTVPKGCSVTRVVYKVLTTFASATSAATIALTLVAANDVVSAVAISNGSAPWTAATLPVATLVVGGTLSGWLTTTADVTLNAVVAVEALTAGKLVAFVDWLFWGDLTLT